MIRLPWEQGQNMDLITFVRQDSCIIVGPESSNLFQSIMHIAMQLVKVVPNAGVIDSGQGSGDWCQTQEEDKPEDCLVIHLEQNEVGWTELVVQIDWAFFWVDKKV